MRAAFSIRRGGPRVSAVFRPSSTRRGAERRPYLNRAFSLIEVIAAVVIFAIGMVAMLGLFAPITKSVSNVSDAEAAGRAADAVRARLQALGFDRALALVQEVADVRKKDADGNYNPNDGVKYPAVIFGKLNGDVGIFTPGQGRGSWLDSSVPSPRTVADADKFFEIDLIRNDTLTPKGNDATAAVVAFNIRVRWPAFLPSSSGAAVQVGVNTTGGGSVPYDHGKKQVIFFTGSILR
ncbi:MAG: prepilin-type N-terminal cleavage/methylation domain-containing protein [Opitutaceae bacterium]